MSFPAIYSIKRHGTSIEECDREPVQTPGCIQSHGVLVVAREDGTIQQVSENSSVWLGLEPAALLGGNLSSLWGEAESAILRRLMVEERLERAPLFAFSFVPNRAKAPVALDVAVHTVGGVLIAEMEPSSRLSPRGGEPDYYNLVKRTFGRFQRARSLSELCVAVAEEVREVTGLDRVMIYRFHEDDSGEVVAESKRADLGSWLGWRYPAHDVPRPAREIFKRIWIRPVPDIRDPLAELVPLAHPETGAPLEMTHCVLRGPSVMYTEYLANMGVGAALTMPLMRAGTLWGLIACHHYTPTHFPYRMRAACELLAQNASLQLESADEREISNIG